MGRSKYLIGVVLGVVLLISTFSPVLAEGNRMWIPWRTQFDGTYYASGNCGPASLGMAMSYYGEWWSTDYLRKQVNAYQGYWGADGGSTWEALAYTAQDCGFEVRGLNEPWTMDELKQAVINEHPVILLVRYWSLPGHGEEAWWGDHYVVLTGFTENGDVIYHDPAFGSEYGGSYMVMSQERLERAWTRTASGMQHTALSIWPPIYQ